MFRSIKSKLCLWVLVLFSFFFIIFTVFLYQQHRQQNISSIDKILETQARFVIGLIEIYGDGGFGFELSEEYHEHERHSTVYDIPDSGHYFMLLNRDKTLFAKSASMGNLVLPDNYDEATDKGIVFSYARGPKNERLRVLTELLSVHDKYSNKDIFFIVQVAEDIEHVYAHLDNLKTLIYFSIPFVLFLAGLGVLVVSSVALRPLRDFSEDVGKIRESSLHRRIEAYKVSKELSELASSFNFMMENIEKAFSQQKRFLADASHELRTPTSVIKSCSEVYLRKERTLDEYKEALQIIVKNAGEMEQIVNKMLTLSRMEHRSFTIRKRDVALCQTFNKIISIVRSLANKNTVTVETDLPGEEIIVQGDESALSEAFMNVIENSIKYNRKGGTVSVSLTVKNDEAVIIVRDTGIGIPEASLSRIFERFYRAEKTTGQRSETFHGAGLGLSIAKETIEAHKGRIDVQSEVGKGSIFTFYLPVKG